MARIRHIKPEFFTDRKLASCGPQAMLLFAGLWCVADREGRLIDAPNFIAGQIFPYDSGSDCDQILEKLATCGMIIRYEVGSEKYIQIVNFLKHQRPNVKETQSIIPEPRGQTKRSLRRCPARSKTVPDTASEEDNNKNRKGDSAEPEPLERIVDIYNQVCPERGLPRCQKLSDGRRKLLTARVSENQGFDWSAYFQRIGASDFLCGRLPGKTWCADFEWAIKSENFLKINEGKYDNRPGAGSGQGLNTVGGVKADTNKYDQLMEVVRGK